MDSTTAVPRTPRHAASSRRGWQFHLADLLTLTVIVWWAWKAHDVSSLVLPGPLAVLSRLGQLFVDPSFLVHTLASTIRIVAAVAPIARHRRRSRPSSARDSGARLGDRFRHPAFLECVSIHRLGDPRGDLVRARLALDRLRPGRHLDPLLPHQHRRRPAAARSGARRNGPPASAVVGRGSSSR